MTVATTLAEPTEAAGRGRPDRAGELVPAAQRGELSIHPTVVEKIATTATTEVDHVGGAARRVLTVAVGSDAGAERPQVSARVDGSVVTVRVLCSVAYPWPVTTVTENLRRHVIDRINALTGLQTRQVDITVSALTRARMGTRRELA